MSQKAELKEAWEAAVVHLVAEQEAIPADQLARFMRRDLGAAESILDHLEKAGIVHRAAGPGGKTPWVWLTESAALLAGMGFEYVVPSARRAPQLRMANEARLFAREMFPAGEWLSARVLKSAGVEHPPIGVVRSGDREYAVEIAPSKTSAAALVRKYDRLRTHHRSEGRELIVLCASENAAVLDGLTRDHGWTDVLVREWPAVDGRHDEAAPAPRRSRRRPDRSKRCERPTASPVELPLVQVAAAELPSEAVQAIQEAEGCSALPIVTLVGRRIGGGSPRWRVNTERNVWRVSNWRGRWFVSPASADERRQKLLPGELKWRRANATSGEIPLAKIDVSDLPEAALEAIQEAEGSSCLPEALVAGKCLGCGAFPRFRVGTASGVWRVSRGGQGWRARPANAKEKVQQIYVPEVEQPEQAPRDPLMDVAEFWKDAPNQLALVQIDEAELPKEVLAAVQKAEKSASLPQVILAAKRKGKGFPRYRVTTERNVWRVGGNQRGWHAHPSEEWERALQLLPPALASASKPPHALAEIAIHGLPEEALQAIQMAEDPSSIPKVKLVAKRKGAGFPRYRVTTEQNVWRVSRNQLGWRVRPADAKERAQELQTEPPCRDALVQRPIEDLPEEALQAIQEAEGSSSPPQVRLVAKRKGRGFARFRVTTEGNIWLVAFNPRGWKARSAGAEERIEQVLAVPVRPSVPPVAADKSPCPQPLEWVPVEDLPREVMQQVRKMEARSKPPQVKLVARRKGGGAGERWRVTTDREVWRVTRSPLGWHIRRSEEPERTQQLAVRQPKRLPKPSGQPLVQIDVAELPIEALQSVQEAEHSASRPRVTQVAMRKGRGFARYRVTTEAMVWRVTSTPHGWRAWPAGAGERAQKPMLPRSQQPLVQIDVAELPIEALRSVQEAEHSASPPKLIQVARRKGPGFRRFRVTTERNVWRVTSNGRGWFVRLSDEEEAAVGLPPAEGPRSDETQRRGPRSQAQRGRTNERQRGPRRHERRGSARDAVRKEVADD